MIQPHTLKICERYPHIVMVNPNPYSASSNTTNTKLPTLSRVTIFLAYTVGSIAFFGLLIRYGYPSRTGPFWYNVLAPSLALVAMVLGQLAFTTRSESRVLKLGVIFLMCLVSIAVYAMTTIPFAKSLLIYFDLARHLGAMGIGAILITGVTVVANGSTRGYKGLILAVTLTIFFATTALGDLLSFAAQK